MSDPEGDDGTPEPDESAAAPRPDPLDRPWVHPSELRSFVANPLPPPQARPREWVIGLVSAGVGAAVMVLLLVAFGALGERQRSPIPPPIPTNANTPVDYTVFARVAQAVEPTIVTVTGAAGDASTVVSGVAVKSDRVVTAAHAVPWPATVSVRTSDGRVVQARVVGLDPETDLAVLDVPGADLRYRPFLGDDAEIGKPVVAVAVSKGSTPFVAPGIVSRRNVLLSTANGTYAALLQASVNTAPETAGGGLFDTNGRLVGVLVTPPGAGAGDVGLAVPIKIANGVRGQLETSGKVTRAWLGVSAVDTDRSGARVVEVVPGSPAAEAKPTPLEVGDVVIRAGGQPVAGAGDLVAQWRFRNPADSLVLTYRRGQATASTTVTLAADPGASGTRGDQAGPPAAEPSGPGSAPATTTGPPG